MAERVPRDDPYSFRRLSSDPVGDVYEGLTVLPSERREGKEDFYVKGINEQYDAILNRLANLESPSEEDIYQNAFFLAEEGFRQKKKAPSDEEFITQMDRWANHINSRISKSQARVLDQAEKEVRQGIVSLDEDLIYTDEQQEAIPSGKTWYFNEEQAKNKVIRDWTKAGLMPPEEMSSLFEQSIPEILDNPNVRDEIKRAIEREHTQPRQGAPKKKEDFVPESVWQWVAGSLPIKALGAPSEGVAAVSAGVLREWIDQGLLKDIERSGKALSSEEIEYVDNAYDPDRPGFKKRRMIIGPGGDPIMMDPPPGKRRGKFGLSPEQHGKYDADFGAVLMHGIKGAFYEPDAPQIGEELLRIKSAMEGAATKALAEMPFDYPHRDRYYGADDNDRFGKAMDMVVAKHGEPVTEKEYAAALTAERNSLGGFYLTEQDEQYAGVMQEARENVISDFGSRLNEQQFAEQVKAHYDNHPRLKMIEDQLRVTDSGILRNPQVLELFHKVLLDPLWVTGPVKIARGLKVGYGLAKEGKAGATVSNFAQKAGEVGTKAREMGKAGVVGAVDLVTPAGTTETIANSYQKVTELLSNFTKVDKDYNRLGDLKDDFAMMSRVAADAGAGASMKLRSLGDGILAELDKAKSPEHQRVLHLLLSGEWKNMYAESIETGGRAALDPRKASEAMQEVLKNPKMDPAEQLRIMTDEAIRGRYLPTELGGVTGKVRELSDEFYGLAKEQGQLSKIEDGLLNHAKYVNMYVPRWMKNTEAIHDDLVRLGYKGIGEAAYALNPVGISEIVRKIVLSQADTGGKGAKFTFEKATVILGEKAGGTRQALASVGLTQQEQTLFLEVMGKRKQVIDMVQAKGGITPETYFREIDAIKRALDNPDYLGQVNLSQHTLGKRVRRKMSGKAAVERKPLGDKYSWLENPLMQFETYVKDVSNRARISGEVKELGKAFGVNKVQGILEGPALIKLSGKGIRGTPKQRAQQIANVEEVLSANHGIEMVGLSPGMSKEIGKALLEEGAALSDDAVAFVPKVVANRLDNLLHVVPVNQQGDVYKAVQGFRNYFVKPLNSIYRTSRTVLRSPAFHAVNYFGAVGLGALGLGVKAANPLLHADAHRVAFSAAFGGSNKAKSLWMALPGSPTGEKLKIGDALKMMEDYGLVNQGMMKYGLDAAAGKGILAAPANMLSSTARTFRAQQVAEFSDNYQKAVLFLGALKGTSRKDIYKAIDFTSEYGQNYNRLTNFERTVMRDAFTFYSWNRFILPHLATQLYKNPARLAAFEKAKDVIEYNNRNQAPISGMGLPSFLWMQGGFSAPASMQPREGEAGSNEYGVGVMEFPLASLSAFAGGFYGESPVHAQLGAVPRLMMSAITGGDYGMGHSWEKQDILPTLGDFGTLDQAKQFLFDFNDTRTGRIVTETLPMGAAFLNLIKLYHKHGMMPEATELHMRYRAGRDFMGLSNLVAKGLGMKPLAIPATLDVGGLKVPAPFVRLYPVDSLKTASKRRQQFYNLGKNK